MAAASWSDTEEGISAYFVIFSSLLALVLVLSKIIHDHEVVASVLPEAGMVLLVGIVAGSLVHLVAKQPADEQDDEDVIKGLLSFSPNVFFIALLPPIIFNSGYHMRRKIFFRHITPVCLFACLGTLVSAIVIALLLKLVVDFELTGSFYPTLTELFTFGALISATDPVSTLAVFQSKRVDPQLFYLVFGESVLNDAVGLVLFNAFAKFVTRTNGLGKVAVGILTFLLDFVVDFVGSSVLGYLSGLMAALLLKKIDMRNTTLLELSLYILIMYVPYLLAMMMKMSGIVTILFTGIAARRYCVPNLSASTKTNSDVFFRLASHLAETSIFLELGLSVFALVEGDGNFQWRFILWSILACLIARAAHVYPITFFFNRYLKGKEPSSENEVDAAKEHVEMTELEDEKKGTPEQDDTLATLSMQEMTRKELKIQWNTAHMIWFSGLRGAVAYACVRQFPNTFGHQAEFVVATMAIVLVTVFCLGGTTEIALNALKIKMNVDEDMYMQEECSREKLLTGFVHKFEKNYVRKYVIRDFDGDEATTMTSPNHASPTDADNDDSSVYTQHVDEEQDEKNRLEKKDSLYDFGSHS